MTSQPTVMHPLNYYEFTFRSSVSKENDLNDWGGPDLYSRVDYNDPKYIGEQLFFPPNNNYYSANEYLPSETITFYDYYVDTVKINVLDDFLESVEINSSFGFFVSPRLKDFLTNFTLPSHRYYPVTLRKEQEKHTYFFLLMAKGGLKIDYSKSIFVKRFNQTEQAVVNHYHDTLVQKEGGPHGTFYVTADVKEKVIFFDEAPDIYPITRGNGWFYFSERLKQALEKAGMTGFHCYEPATTAIKFFLKG